MNLREGMRRVGIVLGALGCVAGGAYGYLHLQNVWSSHTRFDRLQSLPVISEVTKAINESTDCNKLAKRFGGVPMNSPQTEHGPWERYAPGPKPDIAPGQAFQSAPLADKYAYLHDSSPTFKAMSPEDQCAYLVYVQHRPTDGFEVFIVTDTQNSVEEITVNPKGADGIQAVKADNAGAISAIQLTTGEWVRRGSKTLKARLAFIASLLLPFCYPVIGFLVPWGTIRVFVWVVSGFSAPQS